MKNIKQIFILICIVLFLITILIAPKITRAATYTVTNTNDAGAGSLRQAITDANGNPGSDVIQFNIPTGDPGYNSVTGCFTIQPTSALPTIIDPVTIDGATQTAFTGNTNIFGPEIVLNGSLAGDVVGLTINSTNCTINALVINGFTQNGIIVGQSNNIVTRCYIGTDPTGTTVVANNAGGISHGAIFLNSSSNNNIIGGVLLDEGNVISGNNRGGISIYGTQNQVKGNLIGTDANGTTALGNDNTGIDIRASNNVIGGTSSNDRNIISANSYAGVHIGGGSGNEVKGNYIGTNINGTSSLGNQKFGVQIPHMGSTNNVIGGTETGAGNLIAFNQTGILFVSPYLNVSNNLISGNRIHSNSQLGIDLSVAPNGQDPDGVTSNDPGDSDAGPNNLQNFPILTAVISAGGNTTIQGSLNSTANTSFKLEFFSNTNFDPSLHGEGESFIGSTIVTTDGSGNVSFTVVFSTMVPVGQFVTATATDPNNNTSEFSQSSEVTSAINFIVTNTNNSGSGSLRQAILDANASTISPRKIIFNILTSDPGFDGSVFTIQPTSQLPSLTAGSTTIDGATQTAFTGNTNTFGPEIVLNGSLAGTSAVGLTINSSNCTINGLVINGFDYNGIIVSQSTNRVTRCYIGTDPTGTAAIANNAGGISHGAIFLNSGSNNNIIGGVLLDEGNVISGNIRGGICIYGTQNQVKGNLIGTDANGTAALGNDPTGIDIRASNNVIGGSSANDRNVISDNWFAGVHIGGGSGNQVKGNFIGTDIGGTSALGSQRYGVQIPHFGSTDNLIGGSETGAGNVIAFNQTGVLLVSPFLNVLRNRISGNSIHSNSHLGIDLSVDGGGQNADGVTSNDPGDGDTGPNDLQNFPVLTTVVSAGGNTIIQGGLNSTPNTTFTLEFFANATLDPSNHGEGESYIGSTSVTTDGTGNVNFDVVFPVSVPLSHKLTATATDPNNNTSEFSQCSDVLIPVELTLFTAEVSEKNAILKWCTATETENLGYHVYRSLAEHGEYEKISTKLIQGAGSSDQAHNYFYTDQNLKAGNTYYYKLADVDFIGNTTFHGPVSVTVEAMTPTEYVLEQSYPNPFNPETAIHFSIKEAGKVSLKIYNLQGQLIRSLVDEEKLAGSYSIIWNGTNDKGARVSSGTYLYTLKVNGFEDTKKLTFMK